MELGGRLDVGEEEEGVDEGADVEFVALLLGASHFFGVDVQGGDLLLGRLGEGCYVFVQVAHDKSFGL